MYRTVQCFELSRTESGRPRISAPCRCAAEDIAAKSGAPEAAQMSKMAKIVAGPLDISNCQRSVVDSLTICQPLIDDLPA